MTSTQITVSTAIRRIRVGDLGPRTTEADVRGLLLAFGPIRSYRRPLDRVTRRPSDFAMVEMQDPAATNAVRALHGRIFQDRILVVTAQVTDATKVVPVLSPETLAVAAPSN